MTTTSFLGVRSARLIAAASGAALLLGGTAAPAFAQITTYTDVPAGAYYEQAAADLIDAGALDSSEARLRPSDLATRAELVKLLVNLRNKTLLHPSVSSFNDVSMSAWYGPYFETAADAGWVHGDGNCYQQSRPCYARPASAVNRAEAAAILERAFGLEHTGAAPQFGDNMISQWYYLPIQTAADHCVLQGDGNTGLVRPSANMNRAEMVVMFDRAYQNQTYGTNCGTQAARITGVQADTSTRIRVSFSNAVNESSAETASHYSINRVSNNDGVSVRSATMVDSKTIELELGSDLVASSSYTLVARNIVLTGGGVLSDTSSFSFTGMAAHLTTATALSSTRVRLTFDSDLDHSIAQQANRYVLSAIGSGSTLGVRSVTFVDSRTVELTLNTTLTPKISYRVTGQDLRTTAGVNFTDSQSFLYAPAITTAHITALTMLSNTKIQVTFDADIDKTRGEQSSRYVITDGTNTLLIRSAQLVGNRTIELILADAMQSQKVYTVSVQEMLTNEGILFSDSKQAVFTGNSVNLNTTLIGAREVPPVVTTATGSGTFVLMDDGLHYDITVQNMSGAITGAHFHKALPGVDGPVVMPITFTGNHSVGVWNNMSLDDRAALLNGQIYVNVHTAKNPDGEIRGQLTQQ